MNLFGKKKQAEIENFNEPLEGAGYKKKKTGTKINLSLMALTAIIVLLVIAYLYFIPSTSDYDNFDDLPPLVSEETPIPTATLPSTPVNAAPTITQEVAPTTAETPAPKTIDGIRYIIKPRDRIIFACASMITGKWDIPKECVKNSLEAVQKIIDEDKELIALEVMGVVDSNPYVGPSAELKQEGLASFRSRAAVQKIISQFSNVAVFEGPTLQKRDVRGFEIKAYYLSK